MVWCIIESDEQFSYFLKKSKKDLDREHNKSDIEEYIKIREGRLLKRLMSIGLTKSQSNIFIEENDIDFSKYIKIMITINDNHIIKLLKDKKNQNLFGNGYVFLESDV